MLIDDAVEEHGFAADFGFGDVVLPLQQFGVVIGVAEGDLG